MGKIFFLFVGVIALTNCSNLFSQINKEKNLNLLKDSLFCPLTGMCEKAEPQIQFNKYGYNSKSKNFKYNCSSDFWTINSQGKIRQWSLSNNSINGGNIILNGIGTGLAFCGNGISPTFYCGNYPNTGITYYDSISGWLTIPTSVPVGNNGGFKGDQFYMGCVNGINKLLYYFDGINLTTIDSLSSKCFASADIAVDSLGRAWVFVGDSSTLATNLNVYNSLGLITTYTITYNSTGTYGSFFLNNTLYIGNATSNCIIPVNIIGNSAQLGTPISFLYLNYYDLASCGNTAIETGINEQTSDASISIYPNPSNGNFTISFSPSPLQIIIYNLLGEIIYSTLNNGQQTSFNVDISHYPKGIYFIKINDREKIYLRKYEIQ